MKRNKAAGGIRAKLQIATPDDTPKPPAIGDDEDPEAVTKLRDEVSRQNTKNQIKLDMIEKKLEKLMPLVDGGDDPNPKKGVKKDLESRLNDKIF